jgi:hypothetical protein
MNYQIVQREEDNFVKFYVATKTDGTTYEVPCILDGNDDVDMTATQNKMDSHIIESDELITYIGE